MNCQTCGGLLKPSARFCGACGAPVATSPASDSRAGPPPIAPQPPQPVAVPTRGEVTASVRQRAVITWLAIGAVVLLGVLGGAYWLSRDEGASTPVADAMQQPGPALIESQATEPEAAESGQSAATRSSSSVPTDADDAVPLVSVGDRWVYEVVDHQDPKLNYRSERVVTESGADRIVTSVRTVGKDYVRRVEYDGKWALIATHLPSGATTTYSPYLPYLSFPMQPGESWQARVVETDAEGKRRVHEVRAKLEAWETVQVPAGTFKAMKVVLTDDISKEGVLVQQGQDVSWYAPEARRSVRTEETSFDPSTGERRRRTISLVDYSLSGKRSSVVDETIAMTEAPPAEVVDQGACPFEGCQLGTWTARENVPLYERPNGAAAGELRGGETVVATGAEVRAVPRRATVTQSSSYDAEMGLGVGTEVYVLYPLGEGAMAVWHDGKVKQGSIDLAFDFKDAGGVRYTWWVRVQRPDGSAGWVRDPQGRFDGMDALG